MLWWFPPLRIRIKNRQGLMATKKFIGKTFHLFSLLKEFIIEGL